ncbi:unnamed protein product [Alopecurus aequalis]
MEAAAVACRGGGGVLARPLPGHRARRHGVSPARRRFLAVASLGEAPSAPSRNAVAVAQEVICGSPPARSGTPIAQVDEYIASIVILPPPDANLCSPDPAKTVQVKFVLQKKCAFGQRFLVVGDDPALGLWDPTNAVALDWSEDHVWTAKTDLPANKSVEFKFLLRDPSGHVRWQHGCNRTLQIAETSKALVVYEDWDDAECQEVSEDVDPSIGALDTNFAGCNDTVLADGNQFEEDQQTEKGLTDVGMDIDSSLRKIKMFANEANRSQFTLEKNQEVPAVLRRRAKMAAAQNGSTAADYAGRNGDNTLYGEGPPVENGPASIFENDMVWLRKALQRLLRSLGLQIGTTKT